MAVIQDNDVVVIPFVKSEYIRYLTDIKQNHPHVCCIEQVHALHGNGVTSSFNFGTTYGWLLGMLDAIGISYQPIMPQRWKKEFGLYFGQGAERGGLQAAVPGREPETDRAQ